MATVEELARAALGDLAVDGQHLLNAVRWVNDRYAEFAATMRLKQLRRETLLVIPAAISAGTVTVTHDSDTVTGNATAVAAWSVAVQGRAFAIDRVWYPISATALGDSQLTLELPFADDTASAQTYRIVAPTILLPEDCRTLLCVMHDRCNREITLKSLSWLNLHAPERFYHLGGPLYGVDRGEDPLTRRRLLECYPYSEQDEVLRIAYYAKPTPLQLHDELPGSIDLDALKQGVLIDVMRWKMARAADMGQVDLAALWRNEYRAQETKWKTDVLPRLARTDAVVDDLAWITKFQGSSSRGASDIVSARDQVWARGARP